MGQVANTDEPERTGVWWVMSSDRLLELLRRAHAGEDPEILHLTEYANADVEHVDGDEVD